MKTRVIFESDQFPPYSEGEGVNAPQIFGKRVAEYLERELRQRGVAVKGILDEDWGWLISIENPLFPLWIGCANQEGATQFLCFIEPSKPLIRKWFRKISTVEHTARLAAILTDILSNDRRISNVQWLTD